MWNTEFKRQKQQIERNCIQKAQLKLVQIKVTN